MEIEAARQAVIELRMKNWSRPERLTTTSDDNDLLAADFRVSPAAAALILDGTEKGQVSMVTGISRERIDELGGVGPGCQTGRHPT